MVAAYNEAAAIEACIRSVLDQDYPAERLEILVYDGGSGDGTAEMARRLLDGRPSASVRANPRRIQAAAWNLGIAEAHGSIVGIMSGHAVLDADYVTAAVAALQRTGADMVGGPVRAIGDGPMAEAIAIATSTPFGAGGARHRLAEHEQDVDTVFMGVARRETYLQFPFDEAMVRNQDDELSYRMLDAGCRIVCDPAIGSAYRSRATLGGLARQYGAYGFWKVRVLQKHPAQARARHLIPPAFVVGLAASALLAAMPGRLRPIGALGLATYAAANGAASAAAAGGRAGLLLRLPVVYATLHIAYGAGLLAGLARFRHGWEPGAVRRLVRSLAGRATR